jgi:undecaprenyl-diphosphatase
MIFFSGLGTAGFIWITAGLAMILSKKYRQAGILLLICLGVTWVLNDVLMKNLFQRPRPYITLLDLNVLVPLQTDFSFPSGHTSTSFAAAYAVTRANGRRWAWVYLVAAMIAVSRIFVGIHYPSDVLAGMLLGTFCAAAMYSLVKLVIFSGKGSRNIK